MRKLVVGSCVVLILSGFLLSASTQIPFVKESSLVSLLHIWIGVFFIVIFPMYSWDHIHSHRDHLKKLNLGILSGITQLFSGTVLILSGIILLLYGSGTLALPTQIHTLFSFALIATLIAHSRFSK